MSRGSTSLRRSAWPRLTPPVWRADPEFSAAAEFDPDADPPGGRFDMPWQADWHDGWQARWHQEPWQEDAVAPLIPVNPPAASAASVAALAERVQQRLSGLRGGIQDASGADLRVAVADALRDGSIVLPAEHFAATVQAVADELTGLGPIAPLLADPTVTDIMINGPDDVWVERSGRVERTAIRLASSAALAALIQRVVAPLGLRVDEARPWVDAHLPGGERFHAVLPPLAPDGPLVTIRTFARQRLTLVDLVERGTLDATTGRLLAAMVSAGIATMISGATGTGKTTLLIHRQVPTSTLHNFGRLACWSQQSRAGCRGLVRSRMPSGVSGDPAGVKSDPLAHHLAGRTVSGRCGGLELSVPAA